VSAASTSVARFPGFLGYFLQALKKIAGARDSILLASKMGNVRDLSNGMERDLVEIYLSVPLLISFLSSVIRDVRRLFLGYE